VIAYTIARPSASWSSLATKLWSIFRMSSGRVGLRSEPTLLLRGQGLEIVEAPVDQGTERDEPFTGGRVVLLDGLLTELLERRDREPERDQSCVERTSARHRQRTKSMTAAAVRVGCPSHGPCPVGSTSRHASGISLVTA